jgi:hypothetical protein
VGIRTRKSENKQKTAYDSKIVTLSIARLSVNYGRLVRGDAIIIAVALLAKTLG